MKKLLLALFMIVPFFVSACSCDKFDIKTYETAVGNYTRSTGFKYKLRVTVKPEGASEYKREESINSYILTPDGSVEDYASELKKFKIPVDKNGVEGNPSLTSTIYRYYVGATGKIYTKIKEGSSAPVTSSVVKRYEEEHSGTTDKNNLKNLVPIFATSEMDEFHILKLSGSKGYSIATFDAAVPAHIECTEDLTTYTVIMNKSFQFSSIAFSVVNGTTITEYEYTFYDYNSDVVIDFPTDLVSYN